MRNSPAYWGRIQAEMLTVETTAERKAIWDRELEDERAWREFIADKQRAQAEMNQAARDWLKSLPWWKRVFKREWDYDSTVARVSGQPTKREGE